MFSVCVIGHIAWDVNSFEGRTMPPRPGGTAYYAAMAYRVLGLSTAVVTRVRQEDWTPLLDEVRRLGVEVRCLDSLRTSHFENHYPADSDERKQIVRSVADPFEAREVDTTGCGDTFTAGYVARRLQSDDLEECARYAAALAAVKAEDFGPVRYEQSRRKDPRIHRGPAQENRTR